MKIKRPPKSSWLLLCVFMLTLLFTLSPLVSVGASPAPLGTSTGILPQSQSDCPSGTTFVTGTGSNGGHNYCVEPAGKTASGPNPSSAGTCPDGKVLVEYPIQRQPQTRKGVCVDEPPITGPASTNNGAGNGAGGGQTTTATCDSSGFVLSWIICPIINGGADAVNGIYTDLIEPLLTINSKQLLDPNQGFYKVWSTFRIYGDIFLVIALLVIVFGETLSGGD